MNTYTTHLLYFSPTETTKKVLTSVAQGLGFDAEHHDITKINHAEILKAFSEKDILILGMPVYSGRIPAVTEAFVKSLKGSNTPAVIVGVYGNRDFDDALVEMEDYLVAGGFKPIAGAGFIGEHSLTSLVGKGRPDAVDLKSALAFGEAVRGLLDTEKVLDVKLEVRGSRPYRERKPAAPVGPKINDACTVCGVCVAHCPVDALKMDGHVIVDAEACILCHSCMKRCPNGAVYFEGRVLQIRDFLIENCSERKEPEIFIGKI